MAISQEAKSLIPVVLISTGIIVGFSLIARFASAAPSSEYTPSQDPHGEHDCYCPSCGYALTVSTNVKCNSQVCPDCGNRMRATETGDFR